jgi:enterochelin esterase-like enzyme
MNGAGMDSEKAMGAPLPGRSRPWDPAVRLLTRLARDRARLRVAAGLAVAVAAVLGLEASSFWASLQLSIVSLDFDPVRASLLMAWLACLLVAAVAGALTRRPWLSALVATAFLAVTYVGPWAWGAATAPPVLFGAAERVSAVSLAGETVTMIGVGFLLTIPGAAGAGLVGTAVAEARRRPRRALAVLSAVAVAAAAVVVEAGPLVRYGPAAGLYRPEGAELVPAGRVVTQAFHSEAMGGDRPYAVYLPPAYDRDVGRRYPVVYLLHGDPGGYRDWLNLGLARLLDEGIASGSLAPVVAVLPDGNGAVTAAAQWANAWNGADRVEDSVLELTTLIDRQYRTVGDRRHRVVAGFSEGGFGAANLAARHPDVFAVSISLSGYFAAQGPVFGTNPAYRLANSPSELLRTSTPARGVQYLLATGDRDVHYRSTTEAFGRELDRLGVRHQLFVLPGGHDGGVWTVGLVLCLQAVQVQLEGRR